MTKCRAYGQREGCNLQALDRHDVRGVGTIWQDGPRGPSHLQQDHQPQATTPCPTRHPLLVRQEDRQLRALGAPIMHAAASSMASTCGMHPSRRPGRLKVPLRQLADLPRGDTVSA